MSTYTLLGITASGDARLVMQSDDEKTLIESASEIVRGGYTGDYVAVQVVRLIAHFPCKTIN